MFRRAFLLIVAVAGLLTASLSLRAQGPSQTMPTFAGGVDLVRLDVIVLDRNRRPVTGLTAADFEVLEEGKPRKVEAFAAVTLPGAVAAGSAATWTRDVAPDVVRNDAPDEGRLAVILLDFAIPTGPMSVTARKIAHAAVDALGPSDLAAVVRSNPIAGEGLPQNFTADRERLRAAIESPFMGLTRPPYDVASGGADVVPGLDWESPYCPCGVCQWRAMERVADALTDVHGRHKVLFFIGREIMVNEAPSADPRNLCDVYVSQARDRTMRALDRANVTVHSLDPSGLETLAATASGMRRTLPATNLARQANLGVLPAYTGGRTVLNTNGPDAAVAQIFDESRTYYQLGFIRGEGGRAGERRAVRVRVNRPGATVRSRTGYYPAGTASAATAPVLESDAALGILLPRTDLPLEAAAVDRFAADGSPRADLMIGLDAARAIIGPQSDDTSFDAVIAVVDEHARLLGTERQTITVPASRDGASGPVETATELPLGPGRYELRVAVTPTGTPTTGSVHLFVDLPDAPQVALSGIVLRRGDVPTLARTFTSDDQVEADIQVRRSASTSAVSVDARVIDTNGRVVDDRAIVLDEAAFAGGPVADVRLQLPLVQLPAGDYLVEVASDAPGTRVRHVRFRVE